MFAFAMTLLVIAIALPAGLSGEEFPEALARVVSKIPIMALSIAIVASAWFGHRRLFGRIQRVDNGLIALNIVLLGLVALTPFPHQVLGDYPHEPLAYVLYAVVLGAVNAAAVAMDVYVRRRDLLREDQSILEYRREVAQGLITAAGFLLSVPLAFVLVGLTPILWIATLPINRLLVDRLLPGPRQARPAD